MKITNKECRQGERPLLIDSVWVFRILGHYTDDMGFIQFFNLSAQNILQKKKQQKFILLNIKTFIAKTCSQLEPCCGVKAARCKQVVAKKAGKIHGPSITLSGDKPTPTPHALHPLSILMNVLLN